MHKLLDNIFSGKGVLVAIIYVAFISFFIDYGKPSCEAESTVEATYLGAVVYKNSVVGAFHLTQFNRDISIPIAEHTYISREVGDVVTLCIDNQTILGNVNCQSVVMNMLGAMFSIFLAILVILVFYGIVSVMDGED